MSYLLEKKFKFEFKVYSKPTCKNDHIHFYSHHNINTKRGIIIGFKLRALRICSPKYLDQEFNYIENPFLNILYPKLFKQFTKSKSLKMYKWNRSQTVINTNSNKIKLSNKHIILPNYSSTNFTESNFNNICL